MKLGTVLGRPPRGCCRPQSLTKVNPVVTARTHVGLPRERGDAGGCGTHREGHHESGRGRATGTPLPHTEPSPPLLGPLGGPLALRSSARTTGTSMGPVTRGPSAQGFS